MRQIRIFIAMGLALLLSLTAVIAPPPTQATPEANTWTRFSVPQKGEAGDWVLTSDITSEGSGVTAICVAFDGTIYAATEETAGSPLNGYNLFKSTDDGYTWTSLWKIPANDKPAGGPVSDPQSKIIALVLPRWEDSETLYLATQYNGYKSEDGGENFDKIGAKPTYGSGTTNTNSRLITSFDVTADDDNYLVVVGSSDSDAGDFGGVYIYDESKTFAPWADLWVGSGAAGTQYDVLDVAFSPNFTDDQQIVALVTDEVDTAVTTRLGWSDWGATIGDATLSGVVPTGGRLAFPSDYDAEVSNDGYFQYIGLNAGAASAVYMIIGERFPDSSTAFPLFVPDAAKAIHSLAVVGEAFNATLIAGLTSGSVMYSDMSGATWQTASTPPSVAATATDTYIVLGTLQASGYVVYAGTSGTNGGFARSVDSGDTWSRTAFISDDLLRITDFALSPNYGNNDGTMYMITVGHSAKPILWFTADSGTTWEAVLTAGQEITLPSGTTKVVPNFDKVALSPGFAYDTTVFISQSDADSIWRSTDNGFHFSPLRRQTGTAGNIDSWAIVDNQTVFIGDSAGNFYKTTDYGKKWSDAIATGLSRFSSMAISPDYENDSTILAGDGDGSIFISEDEGDTWKQVGDDLAAADDTFIAFDPDYATNHTIYAASGDEVDRGIIDPEEDWEDQKWEEFTTGMTEASGIAVAADGTLYASDENAGNGSWRSLNPTDSEIGDAFFEQADTDLAGTAELASLHVTGGSNVLWSRNAEVSAEDELWTYKDTLAAPVVLTLPKNGGGLTDTDKVTLKWEELTGVELYEIKVNTEDDFGSATAVAVADEDDTEVTVRNLDDGTKYYWKVRVKAGEPLRSPWSKVWVFTTKLFKVTEPTNRSPENGDQDVILKPAFGWNSVGDSTGYNLEVSASPDFASLVTLADTSINSWAIDTTLSYSTTYYWRVRAVKDDLVISGWRSAIFTTMAKPVTPPPPVEILPPPPAPPIPPAPPPSPPQSTILPYIWAMISITSALFIVVLVLIIRSR